MQGMENALSFPIDLVEQAIHQEDIRGVDELISTVSDINKRILQTETYLSLAISVGTPLIVELLLGKGANPNLNYSMQNSSPLIFAAYGGKDKIVKLLINYGADLNHIANDGATAVGAALQQSEAWNQKRTRDPMLPARSYDKVIELLRVSKIL